MVKDFFGTGSESIRSLISALILFSVCILFAVSIVAFGPLVFGSPPASSLDVLRMDCNSNFKIDVDYGCYHDNVIVFGIANEGVEPIASLVFRIKDQDRTSELIYPGIGVNNSKVYEVLWPEYGITIDQAYIYPLVNSDNGTVLCSNKAVKVNLGYCGL